MLQVSHAARCGGNPLWSWAPRARSGTDLGEPVSLVAPWRNLIVKEAKRITRVRHCGCRSPSARLLVMFHSGLPPRLCGRERRLRRPVPVFLGRRLPWRCCRRGPRWPVGQVCLHARWYLGLLEAFWTVYQQPFPSMMEGVSASSQSCFWSRLETAWKDEWILSLLVWHPSTDALSRAQLTVCVEEAKYPESFGSSTARPPSWWDSWARRLRVQVRASSGWCMHVLSVHQVVYSGANACTLRWWEALNDPWWPVPDVITLPALIQDYPSQPVLLLKRVFLGQSRPSLMSLCAERKLIKKNVKFRVATMTAGEKVGLPNIKDRFILKSKHFRPRPFWASSRQRKWPPNTPVV